MTPRALAELHAVAFAPARGWSAEEFASLCASPHVCLFTAPGGFALTRSVADETELLTLAVDPACRRQGIATRLMHQWMKDAPCGTAFLEVAADNTPAQRLYARHGFVETGRRNGYYKRTNARAVDAVLMQAALTARPLQD